MTILSAYIPEPAHKRNKAGTIKHKCSRVAPEKESATMTDSEFLKFLKGRPYTSNEIQTNRREGICDVVLPRKLATR